MEKFNWESVNGTAYCANSGKGRLYLSRIESRPREREDWLLTLVESGEIVGSCSLDLFPGGDPREMVNVFGLSLLAP